MKLTQLKNTTYVWFVLSITVLASMLLLTAVVKVASAQESELLDPILDGSVKSVDSNQAPPGDTLQYTVVISNSGNAPASSVNLTDALPIELTYVPGSLSVTGGGLYGEQGGVITWTGAVNNGAEVVLLFDASISDTVPSGTIITNTAVISYSGGILERSAATTVVTETTITKVFIPYISKAEPTIILNPASRPTANNEWTLTWFISDPSLVSGYELQEAQSANFNNPSSFQLPPSPLYYARQLPINYNNAYYYRIRAIGPWGVTPWSNIRLVVGNYLDEFNASVSNWTMRRQDTDDVNNATYYAGGHFVHEMDSSWDYLIASPMKRAPLPPYRIETRAKWIGVDNLHSYGLVFGGDWDASSQCPNSDYTSCFNHYYRLNVIWFGDATNELKFDLKRIDEHDPVNNHGRGVTLIPPTIVGVNSPPSGYQTWAVEMNTDGTIKIIVNGNLVGQVVDTTYTLRPYFATFSSTDEYTGLEAYFDWYKVTVLP